METHIIRVGIWQEDRARTTTLENKITHEKCRQPGNTAGPGSVSFDPEPAPERASVAADRAPGKSEKDPSMTAPPLPGFAALSPGYGSGSPPPPRQAESPRLSASRPRLLRPRCGNDPRDEILLDGDQHAENDGQHDAVN